MRQARGLLEFACQVYTKQNAEGRVFVHEHPLSASSWNEAPIQELLKQPGVLKVNLDMCRFKLTSKGPDGVVGLVMKPTSLLTNSVVVSEHLSRRCLGDHTHVRLIGGKRATEAAIYSPAFCEAVVEAYKMHLISQGKLKKKKEQSRTKQEKTMGMMKK